MATLLEIEQLTVAYRGLEAVRSMDITVAPGEAIGLAGPNGAGKSSLMRATAGIVKLRDGSISFDGATVADARGGPRYGAKQAIALGIVLAPEGRRLFGELTVEENLRFGGYVRRSKTIPADLERMFRLFPKLSERRRQLAATLSGGEQQMVAIGRAMMTRPRLLMIDELSLGLAPVVAMDICRALTQLREEEQLSMLIVDENLQHLITLTSRIIFMGHGEKRAEHATDGLDRARASALYLGED
jgi:branched-chain amino acid transport system ATP-binding protein